MTSLPRQRLNAAAQPQGAVSAGLLAASAAAAAKSKPREPPVDLTKPATAEGCGYVRDDTYGHYPSTGMAPGA
jgi:hypothetical protein